MANAATLYISKTIVGYDGCHYVIVPDEAAGRRQRFTLYRLPSSPSRRVRVLGRELRLGSCMGIVRKAMQQSSEESKP